MDYSNISVEIGSYITFGHYEQDNVEADGTEPVEWLDYDLYNAMFAEEEKNYISLTTVTVEPAPFHQYTVDTTEDYVLLLTDKQSSELDPGHSGTWLEPTPYAIARGAFVRASGTGEYEKIYCNYWQTLHDIDTRYVGRVIRPAIWVNINLE